MEIPCHANFSSQLHLVTVRSKFTPNSMTIPCHLSRFYLFSVLGHDVDFGKVAGFPSLTRRTSWYHDLVVFRSDPRTHFCRLGGIFDKMSERDFFFFHAHFRVFLVPVKNVTRIFPCLHVSLVKNEIKSDGDPRSFS